MQPLDYKTRARVLDALARSQAEGSDPVEYLHRYGLLASAAWRRDTRAAAVAEVLLRIRNIPRCPLPESFFRMLEGWIADMKDGTWT